MKILNSEKEDYHIHSSNFSDGLNSIDEIAVYAGKIGMKKIAITDHSQATLDYYQLAKRTFRTIVKKWKNVHNKVEVIFGVEADLLNSKGDICNHIDDDEGTFVILSYHESTFKGKRADVVKGFINAIQRYHDKINIIGHVCTGLTAEEALQVIKEANKYKIPLELNANYYKKSPDSWGVLLINADSIYINSDAHTLAQIRDAIKETRASLKAKGYLK